jgi:hypothetical protein
MHSMTPKGGMRTFTAAQYHDRYTSESGRFAQWRGEFGMCQKLPSTRFGGSAKDIPNVAHRDDGGRAVRSMMTAEEPCVVSSADSWSTDALQARNWTIRVEVF